MSRILKFFLAGLLLVFIGGGFLFSQNRFALVIGNGNYRNREISNLVNPVNDATDLAATLRDLGYNVTLKTNAGLMDMMNLVQDFSLNLRRSVENEGFFWFAGHGLSVKGIHYMLPVDVDPMNDSIIARGSYSVDDLMEEIGNARNKTNLIVIDACRNTLLPGGSRNVGSRGLVVLAADDYRVTGNKVVYSTMAGRTAADGVPGSRNSPFAQAFISNIKKPETFDDVFLDIASETMRLTGGNQQPYSMGSFAVKGYALNARAVAALASAQAAPPSVAPLPPPESPSVSPTQPKEPRAPRDPTDFTLDGRKLFCFSAAPVLYGGFFNMKDFIGEKRKSASVAANFRFNFYEHYGNYGEPFFAPNSVFASVDVYFNKTDGKWYDMTEYVTEIIQDTYPGITVLNAKWYLYDKFGGGILGLGASWKIRLGPSQRFIANLGLSFELFMLQHKLFLNEEYFTDYFGEEKYSSNDKESLFSPGIGLHGGLGFRFTTFLSLDLGMVFKAPFLRFKETDIKFRAFGGSLGLTLWWPR